MQMKKNFKFLLIGVLIGALTVGVTAMADALWEKIDVVRNQIIVKINGETLSADNFLYNNTTYVPIRAVAEALGKDVNFADGVAYITDSYEVAFEGDAITVGKYTTTTGEVNAYMAVERAKPENANLTDEQFANMAFAAIEQYNVIKELAMENGIILGEDFSKKFSDTMAFLKMQYGGEEGLEEAMKESGFSYDMYQRFFQTNYLADALAQSAKFKVTTEDAINFYNNNQDQFGYEGVQAKHILIKTVDDTGKEYESKSILTEKENLAKTIYKEATGGKDFDALIEKYNEDPGVKSNPDGYVFTYGEMVPEFENAAFALKDGEISQPVKTSYGWHIIKKIKTLDLMPLTSDLINEIITELTSEKLQEAIMSKLTIK